MVPIHAYTKHPYVVNIHPLNRGASRKSRKRQRRHFVTKDDLKRCRGRVYQGRRPLRPHRGVAMVGHELLMYVMRNARAHRKEGVPGRDI